MKPYEDSWSVLNGMYWCHGNSVISLNCNYIVTDYMWV